MPDTLPPAPPADRSTPMPSMPKPAAKAFPLVRYFIVWSIAAAAVAAAALTAFFTEEIKTDLFKKDEHYAEFVAEMIQRQILEHMPEFFSRTRKSWDHKDPEQWAEIDAIIARNTGGLGLAKVTFFAKDGRILFSTDRGLVDRVETRDPELGLAQAGQTPSYLFADRPDAARLPAEQRSLYISYVPARVFIPDGRFGTVVKIEQQAATYLSGVRDSQFRMSRAAVLGVAFFFLFNFLLVRRGAAEIQRERDRARRYLGELELANRSLEELTKRLEERVEEQTRTIVRTERLAAIGRMAAGMAHEINTPLASIAVVAESLMRKRDSVPEPVRKNLELIVAEAFRCKDITKNLFDFARRGEVRFQSVFNLVAATKDAIEKQRHVFEARDVRVDFEADAEEIPVRGRADEIKQVVINLLRNAAQASERGKRVAVRVRTDAVKRTASIDVVDQGHGVPAEHIDKIFEPFFTTKAPGEGTGLGLAVSFGIVERHGGTMRVASEGAEKGATFTVSLPLTFATTERSIPVAPDDDGEAPDADRSDF